MTASAHLDAIGARRTVAYSRADDDTVAFVGARGFTLESTDTTSAVDPRTLPEPPDPPSGVIIAPMAAHAEDPTPVFEADKESALDEPGPSDFSGVTYETWRRHIWDYPDCDHELSVVAEVDGAVVGTAFLYSDRETGRAMNAGTGVVRAYRGRGLGLLMKRHSLALAAAAGITRVITQNDATNAPMLAINSRSATSRSPRGTPGCSSAERPARKPPRRRQPPRSGPAQSDCRSESPESSAKPHDS